VSHELEQLYRDRYERLVHVAAAITGDVEAAYDAVQDAFATAVRKRSSFRGTGSLEAWVWRIVVNSARRRARERARDPLPLAEPPSPNGGGGRDDDRTLRAWLAVLPERQRLVVFLRYYGDLEYPAIARILGVKVGTVSATLHSAHAALRRAAEELTT
jgi:RNA polymerase sigma-70 factor, ECF subfamily